jgi:hypothetical protein
MNSNDVEQWLESMNEEHELIKKIDVWELTNLSSQRKAIGYKWVIKKKFKVDKALKHIYKARLVAKGFTQQPGVDFIDTSSLLSNLVKFVMVA